MTNISSGEEGIGQFLECVYTQHLSLYSDFCAKLLWGVYRNTDVVFAALGRGLSVNGGGGENPIFKMCVQPKIYHSIHIFVPNILGVY